MSNKELLEWAANAAGIAIMPCTCSSKKWPFKHNEAISGKRGHWNPLESDGDALRLLAVMPSLWELSYKFGPTIGLEVAWGTGGRKTGKSAYRNPLEKGGASAALRRVIVEVFAQIGQSKEGPV